MKSNLSILLDSAFRLTLNSVTATLNERPETRTVGQPPVDPKCELADFQTTSTKHFHLDAEAQALVANTAKLANMKAVDYDALFYPSGHGPLWDLTDNTDSIALIEGFLASNKPVAAVCHATAAFY